MKVFLIFLFSLIYPFLSYSESLNDSREILIFEALQNNYNTSLNLYLGEYYTLWELGYAKEFLESNKISYLKKNFNKLSFSGKNLPLDFYFSSGFISDTHSGSKRKIFSNNGTGPIAGDIYPFSFLPRNTKYKTIGMNSELLLNFEINLGKYCFLKLEPQSTMNYQDFSTLNRTIDFRSLFLSIGNQYFDLKAGKDYFVDGPSKYNKLVFSENTPHFWHLLFTSHFPTYLPVISKFRMRYLLGVLNKNSIISNPLISGWKLSGKVFPFFELGVGHYFMFNGKGTEKFSVNDYIRESVLQPKGSNKADSGTSNHIGNHFGSVDVIFTLPWLFNIRIYGELGVDDVHTPIKYMLKDSIGYTAGIYLPDQLINDLTFRIEGTTLPPRFYRHGLYTDGWSDNLQILGSTTGPDTNQLTSEIIYHFDSFQNYSLTFNILESQNNLYKAISGNNTDYFDFDQHKLVKEGIGEMRYSLATKHEYLITEKFVYSLQLGFERAVNFNFINKVNKNFYFLGVNLHHSF